MITTCYVRTMATYNAVMNRSLYTSAALLTEEQRRMESGVFWKSIQGTLSHLLWGDLVWMSRFAGWAKPSSALCDSWQFTDDFDDLTKQRFDADHRICEWSDNVTDEWLNEELSWYSSAGRRDVAASRSLLVMHMFNHQTHHRGQVHALLTKFGQSPGDTDLFLLVPTRRGEDV